MAPCTWPCSCVCASKICGLFGSVNDEGEENGARTTLPLESCNGSPMRETCFLLPDPGWPSRDDRPFGMSCLGLWYGGSGHESGDILAGRH